MRHSGPFSGKDDGLCGTARIVSLHARDCEVRLRYSTASDFTRSGHASGTELQARILAKLFPKQEDALLKRVRQIADGRVVAGVHYASDTEAGLALGDLLFTQIEAQPRFQKDMDAAITKDQLPVK